eukprot:CAMPEP_0194082854 /NCGR_PEP_ID=MMETSP0149-20130528/8267_1 /TAXON_ID=122233 /ORGANISM="Chaetoceros debilis, Strain MM31A-1" /LENGTH=173 /DNA_ID=CAMNT_0038765119 /DNA_START=139 /DNA_END=661 /DNA_ORIENTATION=-
MLPLSLLRAAEESPMLVELKSGDTYNGRLVNCDAWMNLNLRDVICTSSDGQKFWKMTTCYIRGSSVKYLRLPEDVVDKVPEDDGSIKAVRDQVEEEEGGEVVEEDVVVDGAEVGEEDGEAEEGEVEDAAGGEIAVAVAVVEEEIMNKNYIDIEISYLNFESIMDIDTNWYISF